MRQYTLFLDNSGRLPPGPCIQFRGPRLGRKTKALVNGTLPEVLVYVREHYNEEAAQRVLDLVCNLQSMDRDEASSARA